MRGRGGKKKIYPHILNAVFEFLPSQNSPKLFCPKDRVLDIEAIYNVIDDAKQFVYIAVMDYLPIVIDTNAKR